MNESQYFEEALKIAKTVEGRAFIARCIKNPSNRMNSIHIELLKLALRWSK